MIFCPLCHSLCQCSIFIPVWYANPTWLLTVWFLFQRRVQRHLAQKITLAPDTRHSVVCQLSSFVYGSLAAGENSVDHNSVSFFFFSFISIFLFCLSLRCTRYASAWREMPFAEHCKVVHLKSLLILLTARGWLLKKAAYAF